MAAAAAASGAAPVAGDLPESIARLDGLASVLAELPDRFDFPASEREVLDLWKAVDAFKKQLEYSKDRPEFTFYDGPPFATGENLHARADRTPSLPGTHTPAPRRARRTDSACPHRV